MAKKTAVGIDLGTTYSCVAVFEDGQCGENAASFEKETDVGYVLALESDGDGTDGQDIDIAAE